MYEARLHSCATCSVNRREEQLWSNSSPVALCRWEKEEAAKALAVSGEGEGGEEEGKEGPSSHWDSPWTVSLLVFAVLVALILGQAAV